MKGLSLFAGFVLGCLILTGIFREELAVRDCRSHGYQTAVWYGGEAYCVKSVGAARVKVELSKVL